MAGTNSPDPFLTWNKVGLDTADMLWLDNETPGASPAAVAACARARPLERLEVLAAGAASSHDNDVSTEPRPS